MKAVIMAGGEGTRLRPQTSNLPKPMLPLANRPMMEHIIELLRKHGINEIVVTVAFMANTIRSYFGDGSELGVRLIYASEETPLGTAGSVGNARDELRERFLVISGDVLTDIDLSAIVAFHEEKKAMVTVALSAVDNPLEFGVVITQDDGSIDRFVEKPGWGQVFSDTINTGIYVLEPEIFDYIPVGRSVDFSSEVFPSVLADAKPMYGFVAEGYWEDVGTSEAYLKAHRDILDQRVRISIDGFELRPGVWLGKGSRVDPSALIDGPAIIGVNCSVGPRVVLGKYASLGSNVRIAEGAEVLNSVIGENGYIGAGVRLEGTVVGRSCNLRQGARCEPGSVLGEGCLIGSNADIRGGVKVYPFKTVESGATIVSSIVWESRGARTLFGQDGVRGIANVDITPELAIRLSMAWASTLDKGVTVSASRDTSRTARILKRAVMVGCNAAGVNVEDLEVATVPVTRHQVRTSSSQAGVTIRLVPEDPQAVIMRFFDEDGLDLDEGAQRKIERFYHREEFRRVLASEIGDLDFPARVVEHYTADLVSRVDLSSARREKLKLVLDLSYGSTSFVMPNLLSKLQADVLVVNPYANTPGMMAVDRQRSASSVADLVKASGADLGAVLDASGEQLTIVDQNGTVLSDDQATLALLQLVLITHDKGDAQTHNRPTPPRIVLPITASNAAIKMCEDAGAELLFSKLSTADLMNLAGESSANFAATQFGGFMFPAFLPACDGAAALVELVAMLSLSKKSLSDVVAGLEPVHSVRGSLRTQSEQKGLVMRTLVEQMTERDMVLLDGVKIMEDGGWVLIFPDSEEPETHIWAEGASDSHAQVMLDRYFELLSGIIS